MKSSAKMKLLDKLSPRGKSFEIKEEKSDILSSNKVNHGFSSLVLDDGGKTIEQLIYEYARIFVDSLHYELAYEQRPEKSSHLL
jgi:hypothetical protein